MLSGAPCIIKNPLSKASACLLACAVLFPPHAAQGEPTKSESTAPQPVSYRDVLKTLPEQLSGDPARKQQMEMILKEAQRIRNLPLLERATSLEELRNPGSKRIAPLDKSANEVEKIDAKKAHIFAVGQSDVNLTQMIGAELPLLAAAYAITGERSFVDRIAAQLRETAKWDPLQRPGWTLFNGKGNLPPDGNDGVWLATGEGLAAIWQTLDILPEGALPADVMAAIREQLKRESRRVTRDWQHKIMWFVKENDAATNQWITPAVGQAVACAMLGKDADPVDYELAVSNLLRSVNSLGSDGSTSEGPGYGTDRTAPMLFIAAQALAKAGDHRLTSHPFFKKFPVWMAMQFQPGQWMVNDFDNFGGARGLYYQKAADFARMVVLSQDPCLGWTFRNVIKVLPYDFHGLLSLVIRDSALRQPPLWGAFAQSHSAIWRSSWAEASSGVWVRGGYEHDGHDHNDRGHVNFIVDGNAVLIEAGTPGYGDPLKHEHFDSIMGHNVLQVGDDLYPKKAPAPITVNRMDETGGEVTVQAGAGYPTVKSWQRHVTWTARKMEITDEVTLTSPGKVLFRWHLGSEQTLKIAASGEMAAAATLPCGRIVFTNPPSKTAKTSDWAPPAKDVMETPGATLQVRADQAIECTAEKDMDHAFRFRVPHHLHTTLVVRSAKPVASITLKTTVDAPPPVAPANP